jgi:hypothetical protein
MKFALFAFISSLGIVALLQEYVPQERLTDKIVFDFNENFSNFSAPTLRALTFGYERAASSLLWLRFLQQTPPSKVQKGQVSWIYRDLDAITELDPGFYPAYENGGIFLSVIREDKKGAEQILLKGEREFPERWRLYAYLAYHYQWELYEPSKAAEQYRLGAKLPGAPYLLGVLASSFIKKESSSEDSERFLEGLLHEAKDPAAKIKFEEKLKQLREERSRESGKRVTNKKP